MTPILTVYNKRGETIGVFESRYHITENEFVDMDHPVVRQTLKRKMEEGLFEEPGILNVSDYYLVLEGRPVPSKIIEKEITGRAGKLLARCENTQSFNRGIILSGKIRALKGRKRYE